MATARKLQGGELSEAEAIERAKQGDGAAFEVLYNLHRRRVYSLCLRMTANTAEAEDLTQEVFLRVYRNLHTFRFDCSFHTWLYRIVTNLCLDHLRKRKVRREESGVVDGEDGVRDRLQSVPEGGVDGDPQRVLFSRQVKARIDTVLAELTPRERMVFELRHYQGLRLRAIGEVLGTTEEAAKNCLFRATQKMRAALEDFV